MIFVRFISYNFPIKSNISSWDCIFISFSFISIFHCFLLNRNEKFQLFSFSVKMSFCFSDHVVCYLILQVPPCVEFFRKKNVFNQSMQKKKIKSLINLSVIFPCAYICEYLYHNLYRKECIYWDKSVSFLFSIQKMNILYMINPNIKTQKRLLSYVLNLILFKEHNSREIINFHKKINWSTANRFIIFNI